MKLKLTVEGNRVFVDGSECTINITSYINKICSYRVKGYQFSPAFKRGWNGYNYLYSASTKSFPAGLLSYVKESLDKYFHGKMRIEVEDKRPSYPQVAPISVPGLPSFGEDKYDYQVEACKAFVKNPRMILKCATNAGKTLISAAIINAFRLKTLFIVPGIELLNQTYEDMVRYLKVPADSIGLIGGGNYTFGNVLTIATIDSLYNMLEADDLKCHRFQMVIGDEVHTLGSSTGYKVLDALDCSYRLGMSGTPILRTDGANLRVIAQFGPVGYEINNSELIKRGVSVPAEVYFNKVDKPIMPVDGGLTWQEVQLQGIVENDYLNKKIAQECVESVKHKEPTIVIVQIIKHGEHLLKLLEQEGLSKCIFVSGEKSTSHERKKAIKDFNSGKINILIGTSILTTGLNLKVARKIILGDSGKSAIKLLQTIGRGLRTSEDTGKSKVKIIDYLFTTHKWLSSHSLERIKIYKNEGCFKLIVNS